MSFERHTPNLDIYMLYSTIGRGKIHLQPNPKRNKKSTMPLPSDQNAPVQPKRPPPFPRDQNAPAALEYMDSEPSTHFLTVRALCLVTSTRCLTVRALCSVPSTREYSLNGNLMRIAQKEFLESLVNHIEQHHLRFTKSDKEIEDLKRAVNEYMEKIVYLLKRVAGVHITSKYLVGSIAENTKIINPDEFDYIFTLHEDHFHDRLDIEIHSKCEKHEGTHPHMQLKKSGTIEEDNFYFETAFYKMREINDTEMEPIETTTGILEWRQLIPYLQGPAMTCRWMWIPKEGNRLCISADIVLAIERKGIENLVNVENFTCNKYKQVLLQENNYFIIRRPPNQVEEPSCPLDRQLKFTFTTAEVRIMNEALSDSHKICYKFLKFLFGEGCHFKPSSYQMKCLTIKHAAQCGEDSDPVYMIDCIKDILKRLDILYNSEHERQHDENQSLFLPDVRIISDPRKVKRSDGIRTNISKLEQILNSLVKISTDDRQYNRVYKQLICELSENIS
ncbi:hypothetical protein ACF0H5_002701 [Mactra antiquata]